MPKFLEEIQEIMVDEEIHPNLQYEYNQLQDLNFILRKKAERHTRKLRMGKIPWSPQYQETRNHIELWRLATRLFNTPTSKRRIRRFMKKCHNTDALQVSLETA